MKTYLFTFTTGYGLGVTLIKATTKEEAIDIAKKDNLTWEPFDILCIEDLPKKIGICFQAHT